MKKDKEMKDNLNETASTEPKTKAPKGAKVKTSKKKSKMPEGYIGRPKPMRTKPLNSINLQQNSILA